MAVPSQFVPAPAELTTPSQFDLTQADRNFQQIQAVENRWSLPRLPDMAKLDLATMPGADEDGIYGLLTGLDDDLNQNRAEEPARPRIPLTDPLRLTGRDQAEIIVSSLSSNPPPTRPTADAVKLLKLRAIDEGLIDMDPSQVDSTWSPELNSVRGEMAFNDYNRALRGDRFGAIPIGDENHGLLKLLDDFTNPAGLLSAATQLDLFPDIGAVKREARSWGDKWREFAASDNPVDAAGNLFDALLGPIDDAILPVINVGLMFTGVGAVFNTARVGWMGARGVKALDTAGDIYGATRGASGLLARGRSALWGDRALKAADTNLRFLGETSWLARRAQRSRRFASIGRGMEEWRRNPLVKASKAVVQPGMRAGFLSQVEERLPTFQGGVSLADVSPEVEQLSSGLYVASQQLWMTPFEVLFTPYNIFRPGTFVRNAQAAKRGVSTALGTIGGRAVVGAGLGAGAGLVTGEDAGDIGEAAAVGAGIGAAAPVIGRGISTSAGGAAVKGGVLGAAAGAFLGDGPEDMAVGAMAGAGIMALTPSARRKFFKQHGEAMSNRVLRGLGNMMMRTSFVPLAQDQHIAASFDRGMRYMLRNQPDDLQGWVRTVESDGVVEAFSRHTNTDREVAAGAIGFMFISSSIDYIARAQAKVVDGPGEELRYLQARNKLISQIRQFNPEKPTAAVLDEVADAMAWTRGAYTSPQEFHQARRAIRAELEASPEDVQRLIDKHNEQAVETLHQLTRESNLPSLRSPNDPIPVRPTGAPGVERFAREGMEARARLMEAYMPRVRDHFLNFGEFVARSHEIRTLRTEGLLDAAQLRPFRTRAQNLRKIRNRDRIVQTANELADPEGLPPSNRSIAGEINRNLVDLFRPGRVDESALRRANVSPLAWANESGRATVMRLDSKSSQEWAELGETIKDHLDARSKLAHLTAKVDFRRILARAAPTLDQRAKLDSLSARQISRLVEALPAKDIKGNRDQLKYLLNYAKRHELTVADLDAAVARKADELASNTRLWDEFGLDPYALDDDGKVIGGFDALERRFRQAQDKIPLTASEIDVPELVAYLRRTGNDAGADRVLELQNRLAADGYRLVHGVEFMMPEDLAFGEIFSDVTRRNLNALTLGNFFKGRLPIERIVLEDRRQRQAVVNWLSKIRNRDLSPESQEVDHVMDALHQFLRDKQDQVTEALRQADRQGIIERTTVRARSSFTPIRLDDMQQRKNEIVPMLDNYLGARIQDWDTKDSEAVWRSIADFRNREFQDMGVYALEASVRSSNQAAWFLKTLSGTKWLERLGPNPNRAQRFLARGRGKRLAGGAIGAAVGRQQDPEGETGAGAPILGALAGVAGASVAPAALGKLGLDELAAKADLSKYGFLADNLARMRDSLRFTLSPMFDLSRFTEGMMLAQTAAPFRKANGERIVMPFNMTPRSLKRQIGTTKYDKNISKFQAMARNRGDFDADAIDSTGRWFKQVGILGFSPVDWMGTAFVRLVDEGLDADSAYQAAREMYTYGVRGRSAAELSANFVFFPFSFQKKAIGHVAKWMNQDLTRSILIHDALQTYQVLDEKFNLDEYWRNHMPWLQQLQRMNLLAYGVSPGRFGGINSQLFESSGKLAWNLFVPVGVPINDVTAMEELVGTEEQRANGRLGGVMGNLMPAINDINWMIRNAAESDAMLGLNPMWSDRFMTDFAEIRSGYDEWNAYKKDLETQLKGRGFELTDIHRMPWLGQEKLAYDRKRQELEERYPAWFESRQEAAEENAALQMERQQRLLRYRNWDSGGRRGYISPDDWMVGEFEGVLENYRNELELRTGSRDLTNAPPIVFDEIRQISADYARQNPYWKGLWEKWYRPELGPITIELREL